MEKEMKVKRAKVVKPALSEAEGLPFYELEWKKK
jgi:hypothetical protein